MTSTNSLVDTTDTTTPPRFRHAYEKVLPEMMALKVEDLAVINLDIPAALTTVLGALSRVQTMRARIASELPQFNLPRFDAIEDYTLAAGFAHSRCLSAEASVEALPGLNEKATRMRDLFFATSHVLVLRGLLKPEQVAQFKGGPGYRNVAFEVLGFATLFRGEWATVGPASGLQLSELDEAERLADQMLLALGLREQGPTTTVEANQLRQRAFTLFIRAYNDAIRAITYLRWDEDDADTIIPPLYAGRPRKAKGTPAEPAVPSPAGSPVVVGPATPSALATPPTTPPATNGAPPVPAPPRGPAAPLVPGGPGGSPFVS